jgi:hypothetical protein
MMFNKLATWVGGLLFLLLCVRAVAPSIQEWNWKRKADADRIESMRSLQRSTQIPVETIVSQPMGVLIAASTCGDTSLENRAEKAWLAFAKKTHPDKAAEVSAKIAASVVRAGANDPRLQWALKKDCRKTLALASAAVAKFEQ